MSPLRYLYRVFMVTVFDSNWRESYEWRYVKKLVKRRDKNKCKACGFRYKYKAKSYLEVHHVRGAQDNKMLILALNNLECLCDGCHRLDDDSFHQWNGGTDKTCTKEGFNTWLKWKKRRK